MAIHRAIETTSGIRCILVLVGVVVLSLSQSCGREARLGSPCTDDEDCEGLAEDAFCDGMCTVSCTSGDDCSFPIAEESQGLIFCAHQANDQGVCRPPCSADFECEASGFECLIMYSSSLDLMACLAGCHESISPQQCLASFM